MASNEPTREELLAEVARFQARVPLLEAQVEQLQAENTALRQADRNKESDTEEERPSKKQRTQHDNEEEEEQQHDVEHQQVAVARDTIVQILPTELLGRALDFLEFSKRLDFFIGNRDLWKRVRVEYETKMMVDLILDLAPTHAFLCRDYLSVCSLNLGSHGSDSALALLSHQRALPQLEHLAMAGSSVTDQGLALLPLNPIRCQKLLSVDITGCLGTTIEVLFFLQDRLANLHVVRRQPKWMDGQLLWTDGNSTFNWADGVRAYYGTNGELIECLYVRNIFTDTEAADDHVVCKLQVVSSFTFENESWQSEPEWKRHAYRSAETCLYLPDSQSLLKATPVRGTFPVQGFPRPDYAQWIPVNKACRFNRHGDVCTDDDPNAYAEVGHICMQPMDTLMPPQDLLNLCRRQVQREKVVMMGRQQEADERNVHVGTGGNRHVVPPAYWFQQN